MTLQTLAVSFALAFLTESLVEYLFGAVADHVPAVDKFRWLLMYIAAAVGVGLALFYRLDLIAVIAQTAGAVLDLAAPSPVGMVLSGLAIGRGANYLNQFVSTYLKPRMVAVSSTWTGASR